MNLANFIDPCFKADYLSDDELVLVKEEIAVDIEEMDILDHNNQGSTSDEQQHQHQKEADVVNCEEQPEPSDECEYIEPPKKKPKTDKTSCVKFYRTEASST